MVSNGGGMVLEQQSVAFCSPSSSKARQVSFSQSANKGMEPVAEKYCGQVEKYSFCKQRRGRLSSKAKIRIVTNEKLFLQMSPSTSIFQGISFKYFEYFCSVIISRPILSGCNNLISALYFVGEFSRKRMRK